MSDSVHMIKFTTFSRADVNKIVHGDDDIIKGALIRTIEKFNEKYWFEQTDFFSSKCCYFCKKDNKTTDYDYEVGYCNASYSMDMTAFVVLHFFSNDELPTKKILTFYGIDYYIFEAVAHGTEKIYKAVAICPFSDSNDLTNIYLGSAGIELCYDTKNTKGIIDFTKYELYTSIKRAIYDTKIRDIKKEGTK